MAKEVTTVFWCDLHQKVHGDRREATSVGVALSLGEKAVTLDLCSECAQALGECMSPWLNLLEAPVEPAPPVVTVAAPKAVTATRGVTGSRYQWREPSERPQPAPGDPPSARWVDGTWRPRPGIREFAKEMGLAYHPKNQPARGLCEAAYDEMYSSGAWTIPERFFHRPGTPPWYVKLKGGKA